MVPISYASPKATAASPALERTYTFLRNQILTGRYPAGLRLKQEDIAKSLGVSRIPVRDAIQRLQAEGFVTLQPDRGVTVTQLTAGDILELFEIRAALEALAIKLAVPRLDDEFFAGAEELMNRMDRARGDLTLWIKRHDEFHEHLITPSNRPRLAAQIRQYRNIVQPYFRLYVSVYHDPEMAGAEHRRLLDAIKTGDGLLAESAMRLHVMTASESVVKFLQRATPPEGSIPR